ncbi:MAG: GHMP kinase [Lentisphaeria bacterium]|nr:GHMP kinase [Lentisphaeria bacterium]
MLFESVSYARAGLLGNPSDGYYGKTIAFAIRDFPVTVTIYESPEVEFELADVDGHVFGSLGELVDSIQHFGYYGGVRLMKATAKVFADYCRESGIDLPRRSFTVRYRSSIPRLVGLGGSSAICTAMFKALMRFYDVRDRIPKEMVPTLCWQAESQELGISCGMQDRVVQIYDGVVFMDFERRHFERRRHGRYTSIEPEQLPNLYLAYDPARAEFSGIYHRKLANLASADRDRVMAAMNEFADLAQRGYDALLAGRPGEIHALVDANFDLRNRVFAVAELNARMVAEARKTGASAKFAGSGGAIVGTYEDDRVYEALCDRLTAIGCRVIRPVIAPASP